MAVSPVLWSFSWFTSEPEIPYLFLFQLWCWDCDQHLRRRLVSPRLHNLSSTFWYCSANSGRDWRFVLLLYPFHIAQGANLYLTDMMPQSFQLLFPTVSHFVCNSWILLNYNYLYWCTFRFLAAAYQLICFSVPSSWVTCTLWSVRILSSLPEH